MIKENKGITLVEIIIVVAILGIIMTTISSVFNFGIKSFKITSDKGFTQQAERLIVTKVTKALRTSREVKIPVSIGENPQIGWKELSKKELEVYEIEFKGEESFVIVDVKMKESDKDTMIFKVRMENMKDMGIIPSGTIRLFYRYD